jgi:hypothetical protein
MQFARQDAIQEEVILKGIKTKEAQQTIKKTPEYGFELVIYSCSTHHLVELSCLQDEIRLYMLQSSTY